MSLSTTATSITDKLSTTFTELLASKTSSPASRKSKMDTATRNFVDTLLDTGEKGRTLSRLAYDEGMSDSKWLSEMLEAKRQRIGKPDEPLTGVENARTKAILAINTKKRRKALGIVFAANSIMAASLEDDFISLLEIEDDSTWIEYALTRGTLSLMTNLAKFGNYLADKNIVKLKHEQAERGGSL